MKILKFLEIKNRFFYVKVQNLDWNHSNSCWKTDLSCLDRYIITIFYTVLDYVLFSSVDMATHSTQSVISDEEVFTSCYSNGSSSHVDTLTKDEVDGSCDLITLNKYHYRLLWATGKYLC